MVHSGEKPFSCKQCNKSFRTPSQLSGHKQTVHRKDRPYKCNQCHKSFPKRQKLLGHKFVHIEDKPYLCNKCSKSFKKPIYLKYHIKTCKLFKLINIDMLGTQSEQEDGELDNYSRNVNICNDLEEGEIC